jgi:hypothetical protein
MERKERPAQVRQVALLPPPNLERNTVTEPISFRQEKGVAKELTRKSIWFGLAPGAIYQNTEVTPSASLDSIKIIYLKAKATWLTTLKRAQNHNKWNTKQMHDDSPFDVPLAALLDPRLSFSPLQP